jgi:hypothetical protein
MKCAKFHALLPPNAFERLHEPTPFHALHSGQQRLKRGMRGMMRSLRSAHFSRTTRQRKLEAADELTQTRAAAAQLLYDPY